MAELMIALTILIVLSFIAMSNYKPNVNKARLFVYATMKNLYEANNIILSKNDALNKENVGDKDWYCVHLEEVFNSTTPAQCKTTVSDDTVNMALANGVTIKGLAKDWVTADTDSSFVYKDILKIV